NNNAAATLLVLNTLAEGKDVVVSRGELVEIGGSFRIPDVLKRSGARMVEVGTTNRTHLKDYEQAVGPETSLLLKVHQSNYRIVGFAKQVPIGDLAELARTKGIRVVDDLGSGALVDLSRWGLPKEPMVQESVQAGADAVCFSGDKLVGGPQCGIVVGKKAAIDVMKKNPLMRALRVDKMTYAVLEATLRLFLDEGKLLRNHPVLSMLCEPADSVRKRCLGLKRKLKAVAKGHAVLDVVKEYSEAGSGSLAADPLPTYALSIRIEGMPAEELSRRFRLSSPPVFGRIKGGRFLLDCRTVQRNDSGAVEKAFVKILM
ncbi:MAG TPA: L-seryl-tRNA(Sec) selenium transferase, partial [bacterium]